MQVVSIGEGPAVAAGAVSLDGRFLAVQRSPTHIQVVHRQQPGLFVQVSLPGQSGLDNAVSEQFRWECVSTLVCRSGAPRVLLPR